MWKIAGVTGATIKIDSNGDSEGNFSVLALKPYKLQRENFSCDLHMVPVAYFQQGENFPVSESSMLSFSFAFVLSVFFLLYIDLICILIKVKYFAYGNDSLPEKFESSIHSQIAEKAIQNLFPLP